MDAFLKRKCKDVKEKERKSQKVVVRKYHSDYIQYGFIKAGNEFEPKAQCVECAKILLNASMKPSKVKRHLETHHAKSAMKSKEYF